MDQDEALQGEVLENLASAKTEQKADADLRYCRPTECMSLPYFRHFSSTFFRETLISRWSRLEIGYQLRHF